MKIECNYIEGQKTYTLEGLWTIYDVKEWVPYNALTNMADHLLEWGILNEFDADKKVSNELYGKEYFLLEYTDQAKRDADKALFDKKFKRTAFTSELYENRRQIGEPTWIFEFNWKFYTVLYVDNLLTEEIDAVKWVYKWVILSPQVYFESDAGIEIVQQRLEGVFRNP